MAAIETITIDVLLNGKKAQMGIAQFNKQLKGLQKPVKAVNSGLKKFLSIAALAGVTALFKKAVGEASEYGRSMTLLSQQTGIAAENLAGLKSAFSAIGLSGNKVNSVITKISSGLAGISMGEGDMASKLSAMGINAWDNEGGVKTADTILGEMANWAKTQKDFGADVRDISYFLQKNFGMEQAMIDKMLLGRDAYESWQKSEIEKTGNVNEHQITKLSDLNESLNTLGETTKNLGIQVIGDLAPYLKEIADTTSGILRNVQKWWQLERTPQEWDKKNYELAGQMRYEGKITDEQYYDFLTKQGILKDTEKGWYNTVTGQYLMFNPAGNKKSKNIPIYNENGDVIDLSSLPDVNDYDVIKTYKNGAPISIVIETTNNLNGQVDMEELQDSIDYAINEGVGILVKAATGGN